MLEAVDHYYPKMQLHKIRNDFTNHNLYLLELFLLNKSSGPFFWKLITSSLRSHKQCLPSSLLELSVLYKFGWKSYAQNLLAHPVCACGGSVSNPPGPWAPWPRGWAAPWTPHPKVWPRGGIWMLWNEKDDQMSVNFFHEFLLIVLFSYYSA